MDTQQEGQIHHYSKQCLWVNTIAHDNIFNRHILNNNLTSSRLEELSKIIDRSESDVELREKIGQENLRRVKEHYLWKQCFDKYDVGFSNIIGH